MRALVPLAALALLLPGCITTSAPEPLDRGGLVPALPSFPLTSHSALLQRLRALEPLGVRVDPIGESVGGRALHLVEVGHGPFELWLAARHHGNEVTSTDAALNILDHLLGRAQPGEDAPPVVRELHEHRALLLDRLTFVLVPMANPDGAEHDQRRNLHGQDLNRDYLLFKEPETRAVRDAFWRVWPDAGLDLHNEGLSDTHDYDAYYPEVPRAEPATQELSLRNQWTVVHEVEASGAYAGGPNENYVTSEVSDPCDMVPASIPVPPPTDDTNPTAYCEGTHDAFLTLRGAPGWTPESGLAYAEGGHAEPESVPWATRLHEATIASTALLYAGLYDGCEPRVQKVAGALAMTTTIPVVTQGPARFQLVWREDAAGTDQGPDPLELTVRTPTGGVLAAPLRPLGYTATLRSGEAGSHLVGIASHLGQRVPYELRVHECAPGPAGLEVLRAAGGLRARNTGSVPLDVEVQDSWPGAPAVEAPDAASIARVQGALAPKTMVTWRFALAPGESVALAERALGDARPGPFRWHAHGPMGAVLLGVADERAGPAPAEPPQTITPPDA